MIIYTWAFFPCCSCDMKKHCATGSLGTRALIQGLSSLSCVYLRSVTLIGCYCFMFKTRGLEETIGKTPCSINMIPYNSRRGHSSEINNFKSISVVRLLLIIYGVTLSK